MSTTGPWRKSSRSGGNQNNSCVEVRLSDGAPQVSHSKLPEDRPIVTVGSATYTGLLAWVKDHG
ncbi:protein of unknown function [Glycomyces sambucus]|uniref:DUF397 domain-containing protein n=1 Tax=Glycomyces sambucus TaxID=380244 RepID=A0A1G9ICM3_9ACTN|nr:DUF397 domain-containing protein [Glycomyces sambucus]SDL22980.1 protein of unknown function [Glycomyces sambucus]